MNTPFTSKGDMVSELQTAQHYIQTLAHHSYDIGFTEGCRYCEKVIYERVLEIIDDMCRDEETGYVISRKMVYVLASELRDRILALKGGEQE